MTCVNFDQNGRLEPFFTIEGRRTRIAAGLSRIADDRQVATTMTSSFQRSAIIQYFLPMIRLFECGRVVVLMVLATATAAPLLDLAVRLVVKPVGITDRRVEVGQFFAGRFVAAIGSNEMWIPLAGSTSFPLSLDVRLGDSDPLRVESLS